MQFAQRATFVLRAAARPTPASSFAPIRRSPANPILIRTMAQTATQMRFSTFGSAEELILQHL